MLPISAAQKTPTRITGAATSLGTLIEKAERPRSVLRPPS